METVTITFDNGWEFSFPVPLVDLVVGLVVAAFVVRAGIRWVNCNHRNQIPANPDRAGGTAASPVVEMGEGGKVRRWTLDTVFRAGHTAYVTAVVSSGLLWLCAFRFHTPLKAYPGTRFFREISPILLGLLFGLFLFGAFWVEFSQRAARAVWIRGCVYFAFALLAFAVLQFVIRPM
jgi:hypothetical protein